MKAQNNSGMRSTLIGLLACLIFATSVALSLRPEPASAQFIDRITRPCSNGASAGLVQVTTTNILVNPCPGGSVTINGVPITPGGGVPGGLNTQVQFNDAGAFGGDAGFTYNKTTNIITETNDGIGATSTDGLVLINNTAAAAGAQQYSPGLRFTGQGWRTFGGGNSQTLDWLIDNETIQGSGAAGSNLTFSHQRNGGGYTVDLLINTNSNVTIPNGELVIGTPLAINGDLALASAAGNNITTLRAGNAASSLVYVWPATDPAAGDVLSASAPGGGLVTLSWTAPAAGTITGSGTANHASKFTGATAIGNADDGNNTTIGGNARTGTASNTDLAGVLTVGAGGTITYTFTQTYVSAPICVSSDTDATPLISGASATTTVLTVTGTVGHVVNYICVGRN